MQRKSMVLVGVSVAALVLATTFLRANAQTRTQYIASGAMMPNLSVDSRIQVKVDPYPTISAVKRGDIIVATRSEQGRRTDSIKRVIGLPGDKIATKGTTLKINGRVLPHKLVKQQGKVSIYSEANGNAQYQVQYGDNTVKAAPYSGVVPAGKLFCLGDNRDNAYDSRYTGSVPFSAVTGAKIP